MTLKVGNITLNMWRIGLVRTHKQVLGLFRPSPPSHVFCKDFYDPPPSKWAVLAETPQFNLVSILSSTYSL